MRKKMRGVTLIELVVVVAIVALLATVALPSYRQFQLRSHRVEAKAALLNLAAAQEKFYLQNNTYTTDLAVCAAGRAGPGGDDRERLLHDCDRGSRRRRFHGDGHRGRRPGRRHALRYFFHRRDRCENGQGQRQRCRH